MCVCMLGRWHALGALRIVLCDAGKMSAAFFLARLKARCARGLLAAAVLLCVGFRDGASPKNENH